MFPTDISRTVYSKGEQSRKVRFKLLVKYLELKHLPDTKRFMAQKLTNLDVDQNKNATDH